MDAFDGKEAKFGKKAKNCGVCKGKYRIRLPTPPKKQLPISYQLRYLIRSGFITPGVGPSMSENGSVAKGDAAIVGRTIAKQPDRGRTIRSHATPEWSYETTSKKKQITC